MVHALALALSLMCSLPLQTAQEVDEATDVLSEEDFARKKAEVERIVKKGLGGISRLIGEKFVHAKVTTKQFERLQDVRAFDLRLYTDLPENDEKALRTTVELRLRQLGLPLEDATALLASLNQQLAENTPTNTTPEFRRSIAAGSKRLMAADANRIVVRISTVPVGPEHEATKLGYACYSRLDFFREGVVSASPDFLKVPVSVWETKRHYVGPTDSLRSDLRETVIQQIDEFANDYLKANPKEPKTKP